MQVGFRNALLDGQTVLIERLRTDLVVLSKQTRTLASPTAFSRRCLSQALAVAGVVAAQPLYSAMTTWKKPHEHGAHAIRVLAADPTAAVLLLPELERDCETLVLADEPTAALDKDAGCEVVTLLQQLATEEQVAIVLVTHDNRILDVADRIVYMVDGRSSRMS